MDIDSILDKLMAAGASVWLDSDGTLRIDKDAPAELKQLVREHKQDLTNVRKAQDILNARLSGLTHEPEQKAPGLARIRNMTGAELPPDMAEVIAAYRQVFGVKSVRVVGPDEERGIPYKRWLIDQIIRQSVECPNDPPPLVMEPIPVTNNVEPPKWPAGARAPLRPDGALGQLSIDFQPQRTDRDDAEPECSASEDHERPDPGAPVARGFLNLRPVVRKEGRNSG